MNDLTALVGSRICHDLISPLGAIGNGVELLLMAPGAAGAEVALISESVTSARARICFFRIAFGAAQDGQRIGRAEVRAVLDDMTRGGRLSIDWQGAGDAARADVKLVFLLLQCLETAMPYGGRVTVAQSGDAWALAAQAVRTRIDPALWARLAERNAGADLQPSQVQFALAAAELAARNLALDLTLEEERLALHFRPAG